MDPRWRESKGCPKKGRLVEKDSKTVKGLEKRETREKRERPEKRETRERQGKQKTRRVNDQKAFSRRVRNVNKKDLEHFEKRLMEERARLLEELAHVEKDVIGQNPKDSSGDLSAYTYHMADLGTDAMEREKAFLFASAEGRLLYHINEALRRLFKNEYGNCESCGQAISRERLDVVPHARLCIKCKEKEEKAGQ